MININTPIKRDSTEWIVCQIGAREHYILAAELHARSRLVALYTDIWASPQSCWGNISRLPIPGIDRIADRYAEGLGDANVIGQPPLNILAARARLNKTTIADKWSNIITANHRFGISVARDLTRRDFYRRKDNMAPVVFAYSYAALHILRAAKLAGCHTVLGQIDAGPEDDRLIRRLETDAGVESAKNSSPPLLYWKNWRDECAVADTIVVNSRWSADLVAAAGIGREKLHIVPLAYSANHATENKTYPCSFTNERPLRVLFLGHFSIRKGALELLDAMVRLQMAPIHLTVVGHIEPVFQRRLAALPNVTATGAIRRGLVSSHYASADIFILPTHSDGFAITQLEAQAFGLPVIASTNCGEVVTDGVNGRLLRTVSVDELVAVLRQMLASPERLHAMSMAAISKARTFTAASAIDKLVTAVQPPI